MRSGNAYLHGMKSVTKASLAYIAMQARSNFIIYTTLLIHLSGLVFVKFFFCIFSY
jgi:hypothetical protein